MFKIRPSSDSLYLIKIGMVLRKHLCGLQCIDIAQYYTCTFFHIFSYNNCHCCSFRILCFSRVFYKEFSPSVCLSLSACQSSCVSEDSHITLSPRSKKTNFPPCVLLQIVLSRMLTDEQIYDAPPNTYKLQVWTNFGFGKKDGNHDKSVAMC